MNNLEMLSITNTGEVAEAVKDKRRFIAGRMMGLQMPDSKYLVMSYDTVIAAWDAVNGWIVTEEHYSATTSKHQNIVRYVALSEGGYIAEDGAITDGE